MEYKNTIITPLPDEQLLNEEEKIWRISLPASAKEFFKQYSGLIPKKNIFSGKLPQDQERIIERFLCILHDTQNHTLGMYDIDVILTQLDERLLYSEDILGVELLPVAALFGGDFVCLDYSQRRENPSVCIWHHESSYELNPSTTFITDTFEDFLGMLCSEDDIENS